ncbi:MAG: dihydrofolate reductase family protein [Deltaproteobacteria bacterium]|nr:dihydrofolate reductase family protein [Myxococcales bacterium]MDP3214805.1 dihydrofolate reductase family protein [Deltaproteobacteria bacterium]
MLLFVHPVILGGGRPLFDRVGSRVECDLVEHEALDDGVTLQRYSVRGARPAA